jgi:hypothetical protein
MKKLSSIFCACVFIDAVCPAFTACDEGHGLQEEDVPVKEYIEQL